MKILFVDDEATTRLVARFTLSSLGHDCQTVADGAQAWDAYRANLPEVVISDWLMPGLSGLELCRNIRTQTSGEYAYFILISTHAEPEQIQEGLDAGADDYLVKPFDVEAVRAKLIVAARVTALHNQLAQQRATLEDQNHQLADSVRRDPLTGLGNRRALTEDLETLQTQARHPGHRYCMAMVDVDQFKAYNDHYGHQAGDQVLQAVSTQLTYHARAGDAIYRYGGEEFLCVFPDQSLASATEAVQRMRAGLEKLAIPHTGAPSGVLTVSAGLAASEPDDTRPAIDVLAAADEALYRAKRLGRDRIEYPLPAGA